MEPMDLRGVVLLADADAMVGIDLSDALEEAGYRVLGPFPSTAEALAAIERESPILAVLDVALRGGFCSALGAALRRRRIPFLVHSGLERDDPRATDFRDVAWLGKPALPQDVVALLNAMAVSLPASASIETTLPLHLVRQGDGDT